jgi:hypothetical protein
MPTVNVPKGMVLHLIEGLKLNVAPIKEVKSGI